MSNSDDDIQSESIINHSITIGDHLHKRIENHILLLKSLIDRNHTKQKWIITALLEKLKHDENNLPSKEKHLRFNVDPHLHNEISKKINYLKKFRKSYSKKQWFLEAIYEKLEREEENTKNMLVQLKNRN